MTDKLKVSKIPMHVPALEEVKQVLSEGLTQTFSNVSVTVVDCPDLTQAPFYLSSAGLFTKHDGKGKATFRLPDPATNKSPVGIGSAAVTTISLCGNARLADVGGPPFLLPTAQRDKIYGFKQIAELCEHPNALIIGAGAGPAHVIGVNSELINNVRYGADGTVNNNAYIAKVNTENGGCILEKISSEEFNLMGNFLISDGKPGKVIEVKASRRTGKDDFVRSLKMSLRRHYGDKPIGLGGVFLVEKGKTYLHIMPDFSATPLTSPEAVDNWMKFYNMDPVLVCVGELVSHADPAYDLRDEHFHCFSMHGQGGHYHWDTTPEEVEYRGYFVLAQNVYRIDQPPAPGSF